MKIRKLSIFLCTLFMSCCFLMSYAYASVDSSRIYDDDIYKSSIKISRSTWNYSNSVVLVSTNRGFNSLFAPVLSKYYNAPVLFTGSDVLNPETEKEILRLSAKDAYILGSNAEISDAVLKKLGNDGISCLRLNSSDKYEMSVVVANHVADKFGISRKAIIVPAESQADIISACILGSQRRMPVLLVGKSSMPDAVKKFITDRKINKFYVMGGSDMIDDSVMPPSNEVERVLGSDSSQRNIMLYKKFESYINFKKVYITPVNDLKYAAVGSSLAVNDNAPMILMDRSSTGALVNYIQTEVPNMSQVIALGPESEIPEVMLHEIADEGKNNADILSQKDFTEFGQNILNKFSIKNADGSEINIGRVTVGQKSDDKDTIYLYLDMYSDSFYKYMSTANSKNSMEEWLKAIGEAVETKYPGKTINCELWYINSFDICPVAYPEGEVEYSPTTGKWNVMHKEASLVKTAGSELPEIIWTN